MRVTVLSDNDETSTSKIADRLYDGLTTDARRRAKRALLRANPQLAEAGALRAGAVIAAPSVSGLAFKPAAAGRDPVDEVRQTLFAAVEGYQKYLDRGLKVSSDDIDRQIKLRNERPVVKALREAGVQNLVAGLDSSLKRREQAVTDAQSSQEAMFKQLLKDIENW
jgi:hypothetical protein